MHEEEALGKAYDARLMRRLLRYLWPYRRSAVLALVAIIASAVLQLAQPYLTKLAIDHYIETGDLAGVNRIALVFLAVLVVSFALEYLETWTLQMMGQRIMHDLRLEIYRHLQRLGLRFYDRNPVGRLMTRVTTDVDVLNDLFTSGVIAVFGDVFTLLGIMVVLVAMDWRLALLAFCVLPLIVWITEWFRGHARESYRAVRVLIARINAFLQEHLTGMTTVQLFNQEPRTFDRFDGINRRHRDAHIRQIFYYAVFYPVIEVLGALAAALIVWQGGRWVMEGTVTLGTLVAFLQYARRFFQPISDLAEKFNLLQSAMASSERIFALLDEPATEAQKEVGPRPLFPLSAPQIAFEHVWFAYDEDEYVLRDVSFSVAAGERVGIVGATGAGKSTLINLLMRFYDVRRGRILIDGIDAREIALADLRSRFGLVLQDVHLFSGTIASNIRLGRNEISDDAVRRAARAVHADSFIERLPSGYDTPVAERGATLSVGQKQLLSFARALAFDPQVLLLDEATSSIDTETELLIRDALAVLMAGRTTIAIAHRLSTIQDMTKILVVHKGELREAGTHQELLAQRGIYYKLYQLQYKEQEAPASIAATDVRP
ncbi:MAG: ATP-binding cassette domain-containing protein [Luteitalea sp.]|nr:ATP-binding cassette domain-containing protein [Luteitalea sp.]